MLVRQSLLVTLRGRSLFVVVLMIEGTNYTEAYHRDANSGGIALKITKTNDGLFTGAPTQIFSYSLDSAQVRNSQRKQRDFD